MTVSSGKLAAVSAVASVVPRPMARASSLDYVEQSHSHKEGGEVAQEEPYQTDQPEISGHGHGRGQKRDEPHSGYDQSDHDRLRDMLDRLYHGIDWRSAFGEFLIDPVVELDGIIDADANQNREGGH